MFPGTSPTIGIEAPLDVYVPRANTQSGVIPLAVPGVPFGSGIIGVPNGDRLALHCHSRGDSAQTWADQLHLAATAHLDGEEPAILLDAGVMQHVATYDHRDGTAILDSSWYAKSLARDWLGARRRHMTEELYTTVFPEHQRRRVILFCVREGRVPQSVRAYAERSGELGLCDPVAALHQAAESARPRREEDARIRVLTPQQTVHFLAGLPGHHRNVEKVEVRSNANGRLTHYRLRYGGGMVGSWCYIAEERATPAHKPMKRISSLRRR